MEVTGRYQEQQQPPCQNHEQQQELRDVEIRERLNRLRCEAEDVTAYLRSRAASGETAEVSTGEIVMDEHETVGNGPNMYVYVSPMEVSDVVIDMYSDRGQVEVWDGGDLLHIVATGRPDSLDLGALRGEGYRHIPVHEWESCRLVGKPTVWFLRKPCASEDESDEESDEEQEPDDESDKEPPSENHENQEGMVELVYKFEDEIGGDCVVDVTDAMKRELYERLRKTRTKGGSRHPA
ncbi:hypothetical protein QBC42DRAFT_110531 [Cladorrhinum samala]|uniref:Uncharacterized protein n=1 Tax=Cladorrhinum samala TaxID=585594 RepID=A0AAV9HHE0_9PEZI|nr:hypothetical protein QBC42DRAFT_110531 [Cladorrhinum samala]